MKSAKTFTYWVDIVGACNLRCPSCPRGNFTADDVSDAAPPAGLMDFDLFKKIIQRIKTAGPSLNPQVHLYNWGEPLLHPEVAKFVKHTLDQGVYCGLSANLNYDRTLKDVVKAGPDFFRVSLSGFNQEVYGQTHRRGDIERVKANMRKLRQYMDEFGKNIYVEVNYHVYRHNAGRDLEQMIELCNELKFNIGPVWAVYLPIEKNLELLKGNVSPADQKLVDLYVIKPDQAMALGMPHRHMECGVREHATVINYDGTVALCCNVFDKGNYIAESFLGLDHDELQKRKHEHPLCGPCMDNALHVFLTYGAGDVMDVEGNKVLDDMGNPLNIYQYKKPRVVSKEKGPLPILARPEQEISTRKKIRGVRALLHQLSAAGKRL
jgi:MoaA/NifB/PqqE/SkfB family radical SAM enzyme